MEERIPHARAITINSIITQGPWMNEIEYRYRIGDLVVIDSTNMSGLVIDRRDNRDDWAGSWMIDGGVVINQSPWEHVRRDGDYFEYHVVWADVSGAGNGWVPESGLTGTPGDTV